MSSSQTWASKASLKLSAWDTASISSARSSGSTGGLWLTAPTPGAVQSRRHNTIHVLRSMSGLSVVVLCLLPVEGFDELELQLRIADRQQYEHVLQLGGFLAQAQGFQLPDAAHPLVRSEERRVGKEGRSGW